MTGEQPVFYLERISTGTPVFCNGIPWATPFRMLAEFACQGMNAEFGDERFRLMVYPPVLAFPLMSQRAPAWADKHLGYANALPESTIGKYGCVVTCLAMAISKASGEIVTPIDVDRHLVEVQGYTGSSRNRVIWSKVSEAFPILKYIDAAHCVSIPAPVAKINESVVAGEYVLVRVDMNLHTTNIDHHWILIVGGNSADGYLVHDPWRLSEDQKALSFPPLYSKPGWTASRGIFSVVRYGNAAKG